MLEAYLKQINTNYYYKWKRSAAKIGNYDLTFWPRYGHNNAQYDVAESRGIAYGHTAV